MQRRSVLHDNTGLPSGRTWYFGHHFLQTSGVRVGGGIQYLSPPALAPPPTRPPFRSHKKTVPKNHVLPAAPVFRGTQPPRVGWPLALAGSGQGSLGVGCCPRSVPVGRLCSCYNRRSGSQTFGHLTRSVRGSQKPRRSAAVTPQAARQAAPHARRAPRQPRRCTRPPLLGVPPLGVPLPHDLSTIAGVHLLCYTPCIGVHP